MKQFFRMMGELFFRDFFANKGVQMRTLLIVCSSLALLTACAAAPESKSEATPAVKTEAPAKGPQCYSGDAGKFFDVGAKASVSGVEVSCAATSDGKGASWVGVKK